MTKKICFIFVAASLSMMAQTPAPAPVPAPANPITMSERGFYANVTHNVIAAAEKMPEENYSFKPSPDVRSFGELVAHEADGQYEFCTVVSGDTTAPKDIEKTKTTKADLVAALKEAVAYCQKVYAGMTDAKGSELAKFGQYKMARMTILSINSAHTDEHYGNMVTYLRMKGIIPPSSERPANSPTPAAK